MRITPYSNLSSLEIEKCREFGLKNMAICLVNCSIIDGKDCWLISNPSVRHLVPVGAVSYFSTEVACLKGLSKESIKNVHMVKEIFPGARLIMTKMEAPKWTTETSKPFSQLSMANQ